MNKIDKSLYTNTKDELYVFLTSYIKQPYKPIGCLVVEHKRHNYYSPRKTIEILLENETNGTVGILTYNYNKLKKVMDSSKASEESKKEKSIENDGSKNKNN